MSSNSNHFEQPVARNSDNIASVSIKRLPGQSKRPVKSQTNIFKGAVV